MDNYTEYDAMGLAELVAKGDVTSAELLNAARTRAEAAQAELNCFSALFPEIAESQIDKGLPDGPFKGVPFATKDLAVAIEGAPLTNGSRAWKGHVSDHDSVITTRYKAAGLTLFGQTTSPEMGLTTTTESILYGQTRNPWDLTRTSGGSSGGASSAVASGVIPVAQASDGGGSIRIPAGCTGLFGMKPSRGRIPMGPKTTEGWLGQSCVHVVSRSVRDSAALLDATHGPEAGNRYVAPEPSGSFLSALDRDPKPLKIAVWTTAPNGTRPDPDAQAGLDATCALLESLGHHVAEDGPTVDGEALTKGLLFAISSGQAMIFSALEEERGHAIDGQHIELVTQKMRELGDTVPMVELMRANQANINAAIAYDQFLDANGYDMVLSPTLSRKPEKLGVLGLSPSDFDGYAEAVGSFAPWCGIYNQMGYPAMSVPLHWTADGVPLGMMFGAKCGQERELFQLAGQLERAQPWFHKHPEVFFA